MNAYRVAITTLHRLNIVLTNKQEVNFRSFSHFVTMEDATKFADDFTKVLAAASYSELDKCPMCGQAFTKQNRISLLKDGRIIHRKCFWPALQRGELIESDCKIRQYHLFPEDAPMFDFSNIGYKVDSGTFRYAIQVVSKSTIHLYLMESERSMKHHFCLSYEECMGLIQEVQINVEHLKRYLDASVGKCAFCGHPIYTDNHHYKMDSGELIHEVCMERFIRSPAASEMRFPAQYVFPHVRNDGESFAPSLFPNSRRVQSFIEYIAVRKEEVE